MVREELLIEMSGGLLQMLYNKKQITVEEFQAAKEKLQQKKKDNEKLLC